MGCPGGLSVSDGGAASGAAVRSAQVFRVALS